ncbi:MAG: hypothetical protein HYZ87_02865, partial [Candidatus Omnitrophica bacterium]|nr:hypothetical protein [Candidatus Omnitrophota bacterium]
KELSLLGANAGPQGFLACIHSMISETEELLKMDVTDRLIGLFRHFNNDIVEFGEKRRKLPHFTEMIKGSSEGNLEGAESPRQLVAKGHGRCWVCKIVEAKATEKEVLDLVQDTPKDKKGVVSPTRVLVALDGIEENARLLAKEKRVFTLGLSRINLLMDLYGKTPLVRASARVHPVMDKVQEII